MSSFGSPVCSSGQAHARQDPAFLSQLQPLLSCVCLRLVLGWAIPCWIFVCHRKGQFRRKECREQKSGQCSPHCSWALSL